MGRVRFRLLGPLEVEHDGTTVPVPGRKPRTVLGTLLLNAPKAVSVDSLIDVLWGADPPATARTALQVNISALRRILSLDSEVSIETASGGYRISVDPNSIDVARFQSLSESGRERTAAGDWAQGASLLREALDLWQDSPLSGIDLPGELMPAIYELEEAHIAAFEGWVEAELMLGHHVELLPSLERMRATNPMRERLHVLSALATYRAGRPAEAIECLGQLRRTLSSQLGIEPGALVQQLEKQMLDRDPALDYVDIAPTPVREGRKIVVALVARFNPSGDDPESNRVEAERHADVLREMVESREGQIAQHTDSRLVCLFGVPRSHEDDAARAARVALAIRTRLPETQIGVAAGEALVDAGGSVTRMGASDPVDVADKLSASARRSEVLVTQSVLKLGRMSVDEATAVVLTDGDPPRTVYKLPDFPDVPARRASPLVGRRDELIALQSALERVAKRRTAFTVSLIGPPGVGKTKVVDEFRRGLESIPVLTGQCLSYGRDITFWPVADMIRTAAGIREDDSPSGAMWKLTKVVRSLEESSYIAEQVASVVGLSSRRPVPEELPWAVRKYLETYGEGRPLIVVFEDIHWAERGLLDLIEYLGLTATQLLIICTARSDLLERRAQWGGGRDSLNLSIPSLDMRESRQLLANLLHGSSIAESAARTVLSAAEGNPLFIEELVAMFIEDGTLARAKGGWQQTTDISELPVPPSVQALLAARLDRLSTPERLVLEHGALVGRDFREHDLDAFPALAPIDATASLARLVDKEFLAREQEAAFQSVYSFRHAMLRDSAYHGMSKLNRVYAHEAYAARLEQRAGERLAEVEDIVGYHLEAAERYRAATGLPVNPDSPLALRAARHLAAAGCRAFDREDMSSAAGLLSRAESLVEDIDAVRLGVTWRLGVSLFELGNLTQAEAVLERGLSAAEGAEDVAAEWRLRMELTELRSWRDLSKYGDVMLIGRNAAGELEARGDMSGVARAYRLMGHAFASRGELEAAIEHFEIARLYAEKAEDDRELSQTPNLGVVHSPVPALRCLDLIERNLERARRPDPDGLAGLGFVLTMLDRLEEAAKAFARAHDRARELGSRWKAANVGMYHGGALLLVDDAKAAERVLRPVTETLQTMGERRMFSTAVALLAEALFRLGEHEQAMLATMLSEDSTADDDFASQMLWRGVRAKILSVRGAHEDAEHLAASALAIAHRTDFVNMIGDAYLDAALVAAQVGKTSQAIAAAHEASRMYTAKGNEPSRRRAEAFLHGVESAEPSVVDVQTPQAGLSVSRGTGQKPRQETGPG